MCLTVRVENDNTFNKQTRSVSKIHLTQNSHQTNKVHFKMHVVVPIHLKMSTVWCQKYISQLYTKILFVYEPAIYKTQKIHAFDQVHHQCLSIQFNPVREQFIYSFMHLILRISLTSELIQHSPSSTHKQNTTRTRSAGLRTGDCCYNGRLRTVWRNQTSCTDKRNRFLR